MPERHYNGQDWPTVEFYRKNPKADDIRAACIAPLKRLHRLLYDPRIADNDRERRLLYSQLECDNGKLLDMGVEPNMNLGKDYEVYKNYPLIAAEYLAGQLLLLTGIEIPSQSEWTKSIGEGSENLDEKVKVVHSLDASPETSDFYQISGQFEFIRSNFVLDDSIFSDRAG